MYETIVQTSLTEKQVKSIPGRELLRMESYLRQYIDSNIVREYLNRTKDGYSLDISELTDHDRQSLALLLLTHDPIARERIEDRMHDLIQERLQYIESCDNAERPQANFDLIHNHSRHF